MQFAPNNSEQSIYSVDNKGTKEHPSWVKPELILFAKIDIEGGTPSVITESESGDGMISTSS